MKKGKKHHILMHLQESSEFIEIDSIDKEIILLLTRGCTSSYSVWATMADQAKKNLRSKKVLAYKNIHKRTINLEKLGFIEKTRLDTINIHGRLDYKVTLKGIEQLVPYILMDSDETKNIVQYMNKFNLDKKAFGNMLSQRVVSMIKSSNLFLGSTTYLESLPVDTTQMEHLLRATYDFNNRLQTMQQRILTRPQQSPLLQQILNEAKDDKRITVDYVTPEGKRKKATKQHNRLEIKEPEISNSNPWGAYFKQDILRQKQKVPEISDEELTENLQKIKKSTEINPTQSKNKDKNKNKILISPKRKH